MPFDRTIAEKELLQNLPDGTLDGVDVKSSFATICEFIADNPNSLSWRGNNKPSPADNTGFALMAERYVRALKSSDFPAVPGTVPDDMVSIVMTYAYGYEAEECERIKLEHQHAMCAENCVGALLERYLNSVLHLHGWHWCCGSFVRAVDFIRKDAGGAWTALQIKNRDNSENSSSSAIRQGTSIEKWFRTYSRTGKTNWDKLPSSMRGKGLSEQGFIDFVRQYLEAEKREK